MITSESGPPSSAAVDGDRPATLRWAVRLLLVEAVAFAILTAYLLMQIFTAEITDVVVAVALTVCAALLTVAVAAICRALAHRRVNARGPAVGIQLMLAFIGFYLVGGAMFALGAGLLVLSFIAGMLLVSPPTTRWLGLDGPRPQ